MNYYISDTHLGHSNIINLDDRPFDNVQNMDEAIMSLWNETVSANDDVYMLGDLCFRNSKPADWYLSRLSGHKHLIIGNHDGELLRNKNALKMFDSVNSMLHIKDMLDGKTIDAILCHYPLIEWDGYYKGWYHIFGHIHSAMNKSGKIMAKEPKALNAGCMINNYMPVTFKELIVHNNKFYKR